MIQVRQWAPGYKQAQKSSKPAAGERALSGYIVILLKISFRPENAIFLDSMNIYLFLNEY